MLSDLMPQNEKQSTATGEPTTVVQRPNIYEQQPDKVNVAFSKKDLNKLREILEYENDSLDHIDINYVVECLTPLQRIRLVNELHRVLRKGGSVTIYSAYWAASKAFGDLDAQWPPISESWYTFLDKEMREKFHPEETKYKCNFVLTMGYGMHQSIASKHQEAQQHALIFYKEAAQDLIATLTKL